MDGAKRHPVVVGRLLQWETDVGRIRNHLDETGRSWSRVDRWGLDLGQSWERARDHAALPTARPSHRLGMKLGSSTPGMLRFSTPTSSDHQPVNEPSDLGVPSPLTIARELG
jgi:hypothetical protein